jgi:hypothetical protein
MARTKAVTPEGGFIARLTFRDESASFYSPNGHPIVEMRYTEDDDIQEFIAFMMEHEAHITDATVLFANGHMIDARSLPN